MSNPINPSIRTKLLRWLLVPLGVLWIACSIVASYLAVWSTDEIFDQNLVNSVDSIAARVRKRRIQIDLPASVLSILRHKDQDDFYYEIHSENGQHLAGDSLPWPAPASDDEILLFDSRLEGAPVRIARMRIQLPPVSTMISEGKVLPALPARTVIVEAAETVRTRVRFCNQILAMILLPQFIAVCLGATAIYLGVSKGLFSLKLVEDTISQRSPDDLRPVPEADVPQEVRGLVRAINDLLSRVRNDLEKQKEFLANAAHQLRTPVAGLKTYAGLASRLANTGDLKEVLQQIEVGTDKLAHLTNRLLSLARAETGVESVAHTRVDLNDIATEAASSLVPEALKRDIDLSLETAQTEVEINGNASRLTELAVNLIENAILYTQEGGQVQVRVSTAQTVDLIVQDNGPGIPPTERDRVFERFYRILGTESSGSGLGLAIVKEIATTHDAQVTIESGTADSGTIVKVSFQRCPVQSTTGAIV